MVRWVFVLCLGVTGAWAEESRLASPIGFPDRGPSFCRTHPCSPGCSQQVNCEDYDPQGDKCSNPGHVLVGWNCSDPCSCASDGSVVCSVSYRCVDMSAEMEDLRKIPGPPVIDLSQPE